jgi:hypothetical protein
MPNQLLNAAESRRKAGLQSTKHSRLLKVMSDKSELISHEDMAAISGMPRDQFKRLLRNSELNPFCKGENGRMLYNRKQFLDWISGEKENNRDGLDIELARKFLGLAK